MLHVTDIDSVFDRSALIRLAPKPRTLDETGISINLLLMLLLKQLSLIGEADKKELSQKIALPGNLVEQLLQMLKQNALVQTQSNISFERSIRYGVTDKGRLHAQNELMRDGYTGPAPIPLEQYCHLVRRQTSQLNGITPRELKEGLGDMVISEKLISQIGPAINSGRAIFLHGRPGTGKTYLSRRLIRLLSSDILIPHAICIGQQVVQVFDPLIHQIVETDEKAELRLDSGQDARLNLCHRPEVVVGGELTPEMLEIAFDTGMKVNRAPLQLKANNGILVIDDLGRQKVSVDAILNRWIVPLEEKIDHLAMLSGEHFEVPFEQVLVFSSNFPPAQLADDAFLRRIGYKILIEPVSEVQYAQLWQKECEKNEINCSEACFDFVVNTLHGHNKIPLMPCYPRDLLSMCRSHMNFFQLKLELDNELIQSIWTSYFVEQVDQESSGGNYGQK